MPLYSTAAQAVTEGASDTDLAALDAAMQAAAGRIDAYTGSFFDRRVRTLRLEADEAGVVFLPAEGTVTAVRTEQGTPLPAAGYRVRGTRLYLPGSGRHDGDVLVAGAEPYRGGWANLLGGAPRLVDVEGTFGPLEVPTPVQEAAAILTAVLLPAPYTPTVDSEGVPQGLAPGQRNTADSKDEQVQPAGRLEHTTGSAEADRLLEPYRSTHAGAYRMA